MERQEYSSTTKVVDIIREMLEKDGNITVFFHYALTPHSDDDLMTALNYSGSTGIQLIISQEKR